LRDDQRPASDVVVNWTGKGANMLIHNLMGGTALVDTLIATACRFAGTRPAGSRPGGARPAGSRPAGTHRPVRVLVE